MKKFLLLAALLVLILGSCSNYKNIDIVGAEIKDVKILSPVKYQVDLMVEVDNPSGTKFTVSGVEGLVLKDGKPFAEALVKGEMVIPARGVNGILVSCAISLKDPLSALALGLNYKSLNWDSFTIDARGAIKGGPVKKKLDFKGIPARRLYNYVKSKGE